MQSVGRYYKSYLLLSRSFHVFQSSQSGNLNHTSKTVDKPISTKVRKHSRIAYLRGQNCGISSIIVSIRVSEADAGSRYEELILVNKFLSSIPISDNQNARTIGYQGNGEELERKQKVCRKKKSSNPQAQSNPATLVPTNYLGVEALAPRCTSRRCYLVYVWKQDPYLEVEGWKVIGEKSRAGDA